MTNHIKTTALDFFAIKNNLKAFLQEKEEFSDYNFEASGLSNILDVLAHNTHYNALIANFAINESYLNTAQLRESVVSLAAGIGYVPYSKTSSQAAVDITLKLTVTESENQNRPSSLNIPEFTKFKTQVDGVTYIFQNIEDLVATDNNGVYKFHPASNPDGNVILYEGSQQIKNFVIGSSSSSTVYVVPDTEMDISTAIVRVYENPASNSFSVYYNIASSYILESNAPLYILQEAPNGYYELSFGVGTVLGETPEPGNKLEITYLRSSGAVANGAVSFVPSSPIIFSEVTGSSKLNVVTVSESAGGGEKQDIESIRRNAPFQYASQNRMVTAEDYTSLILKSFIDYIEDIVSFGGEDVANPEYGTVFTSIIFKEGLSTQTINFIKSQIVDLADRLSIASFDLKFLEPQETYVSTLVQFEFDPTLTGLSKSSVIKNVKQEVSDYFSEEVGKFGEDFRRSRLLTRIDALDPSILSSRCDVLCQKRIFPTLFAQKNYTLTFPSSIQSPKLAYKTNKADYVVFNRSGTYDLPYATVFSSLFTYKNKTVQIRNSLNEEKSLGGSKVEIAPSTNLELFSIDDGAVLEDSIGYFDPNSGTVTIESLVVESIVGSKNYIKIFAHLANESIVASELNQLIKHDAEESTASAVIGTAEAD